MDNPNERSSHRRSTPPQFGRHCLLHHHHAVLLLFGPHRPLQHHSFLVAGLNHFVHHGLERRFDGIVGAHQVITNMWVGGASNKIENIRLKMSEDRKALIKNEFKEIYKILLLKNISKLKQFF
jgi:hypothetical protein